MRAFILAAFLATPAMAEDAFQLVVEPGFQDAAAAHQGVVPLKQGGLWGLMGRDGQWIVTPQYQAVGDPGIGWFPVQKSGKWGTVDLTGAEIAGFDYDAIGKPATYTPFKYQGLWYALAPSGDFEANPLPFDTLLANDGACITGTQNNGFVSYSGGPEPFIQTLPEVQDALPPSEGMVAVKLPGGWVQLNCADGSMVIGDDAPFVAMRPVSDGYAAVQGDQGWGYAMPYGVGIEFGGDYTAAGDFSEGLAPVQVAGGKWGYINKQNQMVIAASYDRAYGFADGLAGVLIGDKRGFITPDGKLVAEPQFDDFWRHDGGLVPVQVGDLWGVIAPDATDPATRFTLPLADLTAAQAQHPQGFELVPSNPHYYVAQDDVSLHSISFAQDGTVMLTVLANDINAELALWDMRSHRLIRKVKQPDLTQAMLLPGRNLIVAGYASGHIAVLDALTGAKLLRLHPFKGPVLDMVISPDGKLLGMTDGTTIRIWNLATGQAMPPLFEPAQKLRFTADSTQIYAANTQGGLVRLGLDGAILNRVPEGPPLENALPPTSAIPTMALGPDGSLVLAGSVLVQQADGFYKPQNWLDVITETGSRRIDLPATVSRVMTLDISPDGKTLAYSSTQDDPYVAYLASLNLADGSLIAEVTLDNSTDAQAKGMPRAMSALDRIAFAPDGSLVLIGSEGSDILAVDPASLTKQATFATPLANAQNGTALLDGNRFFTSDGAGTVWVWDLAQGRLEAQVPITGAGFGVEEQIEPAGDRFYIYSGMDDSSAAAFDMKTLAQLPLSQDQINAVLADLDFDPSLPYSDEINAQFRNLNLEGPRAALLGGRVAVVLDPVGIHHAYDLKTGALLTEFLATPDGEWLMLTPEGFFAASPNGAQLVSVSNGLRAFSVDQVYQALYRPDLVAAKLAGDPDGLVAKAAAELDLARVLGSGPAPITRFKLPSAKSLEPDYEVEIELQDEGGGIGRIEWRLNGMTVEVQPTRAPVALDEDLPTAKARVALDPGENIIEVVAYNAAGLLASPPRQMVVTWDGVASSEPPALHVLAVGVNDYADGRLQLKYAAADAQAFADAMKKSGAGLFRSVNVVTLLDKEVTEAKLDAAFTEIGKQAKSQDVFLFFLAGHGKTIEGKYYFIPQDFRFEGDDPIRANGINQDRWQEWAARVKAKKSVMIYDTCESGSLTGTRSVDAAMAQSAAVERLTRAMGRTILSASTDDAPALEGYNGHGVMTWAMLDAMGQADSNGNATIEVTELANFLDVKVPEVSFAAFGLRQVPQMSIKGSDFALGSKVSVLDASAESFPATLTHVVAGGTKVLDAPGGTQVQVIAAGVFSGVYKIEEKDGFARIAKDGAALGWVAVGALTPLQ
ncbi:WG repeat-containing protein [Cypionkella sp. TWP1-2-1b2]|uniref:WG repeat-containing protein n=1 Tax=Cypionkella sp. TWP1-2-1b2 TaxID=2804675 RepID=UPI003CF748B5